MATGLYQSSNNNRMDNGERYNSQSNNHNSNSPRSPENASVGFHMPCPQYQEDRKKYLTAKYGSHQMKLIRKRLAVEDWLDTELRKLYGVSQDDTYDCEIDLDEVLDLADESEKWLFIQKQVENSNQSQEVVSKFIQAVLEKADTL